MDNPRFGKAGLSWTIMDDGGGQMGMIGRGETLLFAEGKRMKDDAVHILIIRSWDGALPNTFFC